MSSYALRLVFAEGGIPPSASRLTREDQATIREAVITGGSVMEAARSTNLPQSTVKLYFAYCHAAIGHLNAPGLETRQ